MAAKYDLDIDHMDVTTAFLYGEIDEEIYMKQPEGFKKKGQETKVCRLKKAIYGLKQGSRAWNIKLSTALKMFDLKQSNADQCIFYDQENPKNLIIGVYVDDLLIFSNDAEKKRELKKYLTSQFLMKDLGEASYCLGMKISRDRKSRKLWIDQSKYIQEVLERFNMNDCNPCSTPIDCNQNLSKEMSPKNLNEAQEMEHIPYQEAVGSIIYASQLTRPDLAFSVGMLSKFNKNPGKAHWTAVKRVLRYLKGTINYKLEFGDTEDERLDGFCDADWASNHEDRRSTTGYIFRMFGSVISWNCKKQPTVAISTTEAEYMSLSSAVQEAKWLRNLVSDIIPEIISHPVTIYCDNKGSIDLGNNGGYRARTKHIDIKHHFLREKIDSGAITLKYTNTNKMIADINTKALPASKHHQILNMLNLKMLSI